MYMNINLTPQLEELVRQKVASGRYTSASKVVGEALRLMEEQNRIRSVKLEQLRQDIREGLESGPATPGSSPRPRRKAAAVAPPENPRGIDAVHPQTPVRL